MLALYSFTNTTTLIERSFDNVNKVLDYVDDLVLLTSTSSSSKGHISAFVSEFIVFSL